MLKAAKSVMGSVVWSLLLGAAAIGQEPVFLRGDVNGDGAVTLSDGSMLWLIYMGMLDGPACEKSADVNDDGVLDHWDFSRLLERLTQGMLPPPCPPFPEAGTDPTPDALTCVSYGGGSALDDPSAEVEVRTEPVGVDGVIHLSLFVSNSRRVNGLEITLALEGTEFAGWGGARHSDDPLPIAWGGGWAVSGGTFSVAFLYSVGEISLADRYVSAYGLPPGESVHLLDFSNCILAGTAAGMYDVRVEHAELVDYETGRAIHPRVTVEPVVVEQDLTLDQGCAASNGELPTECHPAPPTPPVNLADFIRGDINADGRVSISDAMMLLRGFLLLGWWPSECLESADVDADGLISVDDALKILYALLGGGPMPSSPFPDQGPGSNEDQWSCDAYAIEEPAVTDDLVEIGEAIAAPGQTVEIPVLLTSDVAAEAVQLLIEYDERVLTPRGLAFEGTFLDGREEQIRFFRAARRIGENLMAVGYVPDIIKDRGSIPPGEGQLIFSILADVAADAEPGSVIDLVPTNGPDGLGIGPARMVNEISHQGEARFISVLPRTLPGRLQIVGDFAIFVRGDSNGDARVDVSDAVHTLGFLFLGDGNLDCGDAADANDDGEIGLSDAIATLGSLFLGTGRLPPPSRSPGVDPTRDGLGCEREN
jgi:hypothetical protein